MNDRHLDPPEVEEGPHCPECLVPCDVIEELEDGFRVSCELCLDTWIEPKPPEIDPSVFGMPDEKVDIPRN